MKVLIVYYSREGTTKKMAELIADGISKAGVKVKVSAVSEVNPEELSEYHGIIVGSPTYYGTMSSEVKKLIDESVRLHGDLDGKVGGAFSSSANLAGGNETTIISILEAMLIHGMIIQGDWQGDHYGPVALGKVDREVEKKCRRFAERFVSLLRRVEKG